ncbi:MAG: molybdenum cofactor guanylyltransferase [Opitutaceae bacterium]|nr:molybdenum cofactor guanylyltransferase [Opitutaceae bacterium]
MSSSPTYSAVLLAAGRSARMGRDKALLDCGGAPLWRRQWRVLEQAGAGEIFLSARPDQAWVPPGVTTLADAVPGAGPLAGIAAALARCQTSHLLVLAVDLPHMPPAWFAQLAATCTPGRGAVGRRGKFFEPLAAIYPCELRAAAEAALGRGDFALQAFIAAAADRMIVHDITDAAAPWFENWNEPAERSGNADPR